MEEPNLRDVWGLVRADDVYVVPNFISAGYFTQTVIPRELSLAGAVTLRGARTVKYCEPVGGHAHMTDLLLKRAREFAPDVRPDETCLVIVGHGTLRDKNSSAAVKEQVRRIEARGLYAHVLGMFMEEEPFVADWHRVATQPNVVAVPFFIADGLHSYQDIPVLMGIQTETGPAASHAEIFRRNPFRLHDRTLFYAGAIGTEPGFAELILDQVEAFDLQHAEFFSAQKREAAR